MVYTYMDNSIVHYYRTIALPVNLYYYVFMKPLKHPDIKDITVEGILHAFSDPVRMQIFMQIAKSECPKICASFVSMQGKELAKSTLSQHFNVLRDAGLIRSERVGVKMNNTTRCAELKDRFGLMINGIIEAYVAQEKSDKRKKQRRPS